MRRAIPAALLTSVAALLAPSGALGSPARIPQREIASGAHLVGVKVGVSPRDEAITVIQGDNGAIDPTLTARVRGADGRLSATQELSRTTNAELPREIEFNSAGSTFLSWGIATGGSLGERAFRKAGGLFSVPMTWPSGMCTRFSSVRFLPTGVPRVACSAKSGSGSTSDLIITATGSTAEGAVFGPSSSVQTAVRDDFLTPHLDVGPDGTSAIAWKVDDSSAPAPSSKIKLAIAPPGGSFAPAIQVASVLDSAGGYVELGGVSVLADGRVVVIYEINDGVLTQDRFLMRKPDNTGVNGPLPSTAAGERMTVARDGETALVAWGEDTGFATPVTYRVASFVGDSIGRGSTQTLATEAPAQMQLNGIRVAPNGAAAIASSTPTAGGRAFAAWVRPARGKPFAGPFAIGSSTPSAQLSTAIDRHGSLVAAWTQEGTTDRIFLGGLDSAGPGLSSLSVPGRLRVGRGGRFSVKAVDPAGVKSVKWGFGDRSRTASGSRVSHSFRRTGRFQVVVVATDQAGKQTRVKRTVRVVR